MITTDIEGQKGKRVSVKITGRRFKDLDSSLRDLGPVGEDPLEWNDRLGIVYRVLESAGVPNPKDYLRIDRSSGRLAAKDGHRLKERPLMPRKRRDGSRYPEGGVRLIVNLSG